MGPRQPVWQLFLDPKRPPGGPWKTDKLALHCVAYIAVMHCKLRLQILDTNGLKPKHFASNDDALKAAADLLAAYNAQNPDAEKEHPPKVFENPLLSKYWYAPESSGQGSPFPGPT